MKRYNAHELQQHFSISIREIANAVHVGKLPRNHTNIGQCTFSEEDIASAFPTLVNAPFKYYNATTAAIAFNESEIIIRRAIKSGKLKTIRIHNEDMFTEIDFKIAFDRNVPTELQTEIPGMEINDSSKKYSMSDINRIYKISIHALLNAYKFGKLTAVETAQGYMVDLTDVISAFPNLEKRPTVTINVNEWYRVSLISANFTISSETINDLIRKNEIEYRRDDMRKIRVIDLMKIHPNLKLREFSNCILVDSPVLPEGKPVTKSSEQFHDNKKRSNKSNNPSRPKKDTTINEPINTTHVDEKLIGTKSVESGLTDTVITLTTELALLREDNRRLLDIIETRLEVAERVVNALSPTKPKSKKSLLRRIFG